MAAVGRQREGVDVAVEAGDEDAFLPACRRHHHQPPVLASAIAYGEDRRAVPGEARRVVGDGLALAWRCDTPPLPRREIHHPDMALVHGDELDERDPASVLGEREILPTSAFQVGERAVGSGLERIHDMNRRARRAPGIVAIDRLRRIDDTVARAIPGGPCYPHVPGGEGRYRLRGDILAIDPEHLVAALAARKDEIVSRSRLVRRATRPRRENP